MPTCDDLEIASDNEILPKFFPPASLLLISERVIKPGFVSIIEFFLIRSSFIAPATVIGFIKDPGS